MTSITRGCYSSPYQGEVRWGYGIPMTKIFNKADEKLKRRILRENMPPAEVLLWNKLRNKGLNGLKFRRQYSVQQFVIDFYCPEFKLAVEVDGESHFNEAAGIRDEERQAIIESFGVTFLRFTNRDVYEKLDGVLYKILEKVNDLP